MINDNLTIYLNDVVEAQGKLLDYVANAFPDKDTRDFILAYMRGATRNAIDEGMAYVCTMDAYELWEYFSANEDLRLLPLCEDCSTAPNELL